MNGLSRRERLLAMTNMLSYMIENEKMRRDYGVVVREDLSHMLKADGGLVFRSLSLWLSYGDILRHC